MSIMATKELHYRAAQRGARQIPLAVLFQSSDSIYSPTAAAINRLSTRINEEPRKTRLAEVQALGKRLRSLGPLDRDPDLESKAFIALSRAIVCSPDSIVRIAAKIERDSFEWDLRGSLIPDSPSPREAQKGRHGYI
jgi:hypothetical protein